MGRSGYFRRASLNERGPARASSSGRSMATLAITPSPPKSSARPTATSKPSITSDPVDALKTQITEHERENCECEEEIYPKPRRVTCAMTIYRQSGFEGLDALEKCAFVLG